MGAISYLRKHGIKYALNVIWQYKIDLVLQKMVFPFLKNKPLQNIIMIESHNDFDCNGGAFYDYLIENGYNKKYKIVWLLRHPEARPRKLPDNVDWVPLLRPSLKKQYYICTASWLTSDCFITPKINPAQKSFYLRHGPGGLKNVKSHCVIPDSVDYILSLSKNYETIDADQLSIEYPNPKLIELGFPAHDLLFRNNETELQKITTEKFAKVLLWMPTFRKSGTEFNRNDCEVEQLLGIPLISTLDEYEKLNDLMVEKNVLLIIKIHPMQDVSQLLIQDRSNVKVITGEQAKRLKVDNYRLMSCVDALISDYSGAAYDFLQLNRPIAYVLSDMNQYKLGFVVEDIHQLIAGHEIYNLSDFIQFVNDVSGDRDVYRERREAIRDYIHTYHDDRSSQRLADFMGLKRV